MFKCCFATQLKERNKAEVVIAWKLICLNTTLCYNYTLLSIKTSCMSRLLILLKVLNIDGQKHFDLPKWLSENCSVILFHDMPLEFIPQFNKKQNLAAQPTKCFYLSENAIIWPKFS